MQVDMSGSEYLTSDEHIPTESDDIVIDSSTTPCTQEDDKDNTDEEEEDDSPLLATEALQYLSKLTKYFITKDEECVGLLDKITQVVSRHTIIETSNSSSKTRGAAARRTRITWVSLLGSEEHSLKLLRSGKLQRMNSSPISNCRHSKSAIFISCNINCNINSLLLLDEGTHIIYIYQALHTGSRNENNIGAACGSP